MKKPDPIINLEYLRQPEILARIKMWLSMGYKDRKKACVFDDCSCCRELFGDNRFRVNWFALDDGIHPCQYYGPRKTYLAVKKAVEEIEKEGL